jgi:hypothetical protein
VYHSSVQAIKTCPWTVALTFTTWRFAALGQPVSVDTLLQNTAQLKASVSLDRAIYFPEEAAVITVSVTNPTSVSLVTFAPFLAQTGCLDVYRPTGSDELELIGSHSNCIMSWDATAPTTTFLARETRVKTFLSSDSRIFDGALSPFFFGGGVSRTAGPYQLNWGYGINSVPALYQVVYPHLEAAAVVRIQDSTYVDPVNLQTSQRAEYMHVFALRWNNQSFICITQQPSYIGDLTSPEADGTLTFPHGSHRRIAVSTNPIISITVTADAAYNLTITWTDSAGATRAISGNAPALPGDAPPLPTAIGGNIGATSGPRNARVWVFNIGNNGPGWAMAAQVTNLVLQQTSGTACTPVITSQLPALAGDIAPKAFGAANVTIDFSSCSGITLFKVTASISANAGTVTGSIVRSNELP